MIYDLWFVIVGMLLIGMALSVSFLKRLPLTTSILYLAAGLVLGPLAGGMIRLDPVEHSSLLERFTEVAVIVSLFTAGLKLRLPFSDVGWRLSLRLALLSMMSTVGLIALVGIFALNLPVGAAILLGAVLAPTDPVLASDVQTEGPLDRDLLRFSLTGEAGLNDGMAFPFVMLGLGLLGLHEIGEFGWRWLAIDVLWAIFGGIAIGGLLGTSVGRFVLYLRREHKEAVGSDDFLALGLIAASYGGALLVHSYGFLAVFAAGAALRRIERHHASNTADETIKSAAAGGETEESATDREKAPAYMTQAVLGFNEQLERIGEVFIVVLVGGMISTRYLPVEALWFLPVLFLVIRPVSVWLGLIASATTGIQRHLIGWFGIRGIGSIYYLMYAVNHGLSPELSRKLTALTLIVVAVSIVVHGISVTPLMNCYKKRSA